jgi:putative membrane protein
MTGAAEGGTGAKPEVIVTDGVVVLSANDMAHQRTDLAAVRTLMASDRSLMAWVRTGLSMISFGFTIYKILQGFQEAGAVLHGVSPRAAGLFLTGLGTLSIIAGTVEYWQRAKEAHRHRPDFQIWRPSLVIALIMSVTGLLLFGSIVIRVL